MNKQELIEVLKAEGFSKNILNAFEKIPREKFISEKYKNYAYLNEPLPIDEGATISQPYTIAFMLELMELDKLIPPTPPKLININNLQNKERAYQAKEENQTPLDLSDANKSAECPDRVGHGARGGGVEKNKIKILEIGSGCGYVLALIDEILKSKKINNYQLTGIEINNKLVENSRQVLKDRKNIKVICSNGSMGLVGGRSDRVLMSDKSDRILVSAAYDRIPNHLLKQLKRRKGILVTPVRNSIYQVKKKSHSIHAKGFPGFVFVPLVGCDN